jgi:hypothetical protein
LRATVPDGDHATAVFAPAGSRATEASRSCALRGRRLRLVRSGGTGRGRPDLRSAHLPVGSLCEQPRAVAVVVHSRVARAERSIPACRARRGTHQPEPTRRHADGAPQGEWSRALTPASRMLSWRDGVHRRLRCAHGRVALPPPTDCDASMGGYGLTLLVIAGDVVIIGSLPALEQSSSGRRWWRRRR